MVTKLYLGVLIGFFILVGAVFSSWAVDAPIPQSGQTIVYGTRDDGALHKGILLPSSRFSDLGDGTVKDLLTNLIWMKNANCWNSMTWFNAMGKVNSLNKGNVTCTGYSGHATDWRLPSVNELESLVDLGHFNPALPTGHLFVGAQADNYWSSTSNASFTSDAWVVYFNYGYVGFNEKPTTNYVWPVRGGQ
ncbi:MAG: DUF1566 domain-containing protein [Magnetococcus sp. YQC-5]